MNLEIVQAIIAALRASVLTLPAPYNVTLNTALGGRFYYKPQVPTGVPFPRCYVGPRREGIYHRAGNRSTETDRHVPIDVLFATSSTQAPVSPTYGADIEVYDRMARRILDMVTLNNVPGFVYLMRSGDDLAREQNDDLATYIMGGGIYDAYFQE